MCANTMAMALGRKRSLGPNIVLSSVIRGVSSSINPYIWDYIPYMRSRVTIIYHQGLIYHLRPTLRWSLSKSKHFGFTTCPIYPLCSQEEKKTWPIGREPGAVFLSPQHRSPQCKESKIRAACFPVSSSCNHEFYLLKGSQGPREKQSVIAQEASSQRCNF